WTFRHHDGLLTVACADRLLGAAYADKEPKHPLSMAIDEHKMDKYPGWFVVFWRCCGTSEPLELSGWRLEQQGKALVCRGIAGAASSSYHAREGVDAWMRNAPADPRVRVSSHFLRLRIVGPEATYQEWMTGRAKWMATQTIQDMFERDMPLSFLSAWLGKDHPGVALALEGLGLQLHWARKTQEGEPLLDRALAITNDSLGPWHPDHASKLMSLARVYRETGRLDKAEPLLVQAHESMVQVFGSRSGRAAAAARDLALLYRDTGRVAEAETLLREALSVGSDTSLLDRALMLPAITCLAETQYLMGERDKSEKQWLLARLIVQQLEESQNTLAAGETWREFDERTSIAQKLRIDHARVDAALGWVKFQSGRTDEARELARAAFLKMVDFFRMYDNRPYDMKFQGWNSSLTNVQIPNSILRFDTHADYRPTAIRLAELFALLGDEVPALRSIEITDRLYGISEYDLATLCRVMARLTQANPRAATFLYNPVLDRKVLEVIYDRGPKDVPPDVYWRQQALDKLEKSAGREHPDTIGVLLGQARRAWRMRGPEAAAETLRDACERALALSDRVVSGLPEAQAYMYLEANRPPADLLLSCYRAAESPDPRRAYEAVWRGKALATRQLTARRDLLRAAADRPDLAQLTRDLQAARQQLAWLSLAPPSSDPAERDRQMNDVAARKEQLEGDLARRSAAFRQAHDAQGAGVEEMVRRLPKRTAVVDLIERTRWAPPEGATPWSQTPSYDAFVLTAAESEPGWSAVWLPLGDAEPIDALLDSWLAGLRVQSRPDASAAAQLRRALWQPLEAALAGCERVIVIPDGRLALVPWAALPGRRAGSYLIEDYALAEAPYAQSVARLLSETAPSGGGFLGLGGVDYGGGGKWKFLQGSASEIEEIAALRRAKDTLRLSGGAATKPRLLESLPGRRYVHLATHGEFLDPGAKPPVAAPRHDGGAAAAFDVSARNPLLLSMLVLAGANQPARTDEHGLPVGGDSYLTAEEVIGADLTQAELVVLSACETGLGKVRGGEGVFSLRRAFAIAGSKAVLASLWKIPDGATSALMQRFYENLWDKKMGKLAALREAQLWMLREVPKDAKLRSAATRGLNLPDAAPEISTTELPPYYWAAFVLSGDWR
ncbi:MAG TPA: CHAT domain-containing tetratricopeptide repeat protein, partial [Pirellulales bacterium]